MRCMRQGELNTGLPMNDAISLRQLSMVQINIQADSLHRAILAHHLDVPVIAFRCAVKLAHVRVDVCNGAMCVCIAHMVSNLAADLQHTLQVAHCCWQLTLQVSDLSAMSCVTLIRHAKV